MITELENGMKLKSKHYDIRCFIVSVSDDSDEVVVECSNNVSNWEETWSKQDTLWGLELGEYELISCDK
ncbi:MAG: hypothetical protein E6767_18815 [Dysgonomonas sp.]|nr:hypothetical protein [Dysgonomonas sp.]